MDEHPDKAIALKLKKMRMEIRIGSTFPYFVYRNKPGVKG